MVGGQPGRKRIISLILHEIRSAQPSGIHNDKIAGRLKLSASQVRNSVRGYMQHNHDITEIAPYVYMATIAGHHPHISPTSAPPAPFVPNSGQGALLNVVAFDELMKDEIRCSYRLVARGSDGVVLLQDEEKDLWKAVKL